MYEYYICDTADDEIFRKQCVAIEKNIAPLKKEKLLEDVDGSLIQIYGYMGSKIKVYCDHFIDEVCVKSEIELKHFFGTTGQ
ncbi:hypothetical protein GPL26_16270 [Enterocloster citroniae]|uniref:Uncharacterized protein n=1 Tax=Enterocloster citroniae TaxID=358743 RepID=A0AA41K6T2_9FIRM|nr:hypothetical protein [Enterocloster citroniae]MBT9811183.1 hypothetical protein [Enterocloster citroniae]